MDTKTNRKMVDSGVEWIGEVPEGWETKALKNVATRVSRGSDAYSKNDEHCDSGHPVLTPGELSGPGEAAKPLGTRLSQTKGLAPSQSTAVANIASVGKVRFLEEESLCNPQVLAYFSSQHNPRWFFWTMFGVMGEAANRANTTTIPFINSTDLGNIPMPVPPLPLQQAIANYLDHHVGLIDEERDLISKKIELLKEKRSALIFEVVTGKRTLVEAQHLAGVDDWSDIVGSGEMVAVPTPRADDPFAKSGRLVDSGVEWIGEMPEGWGTAQLKALLSKNSGGAWGDEAKGVGDTMVLRSTDQTVDGRWSIDNPEWRHLTASDIVKTKMIPGDILITKSSGSPAHIGKATLVDETQGNGAGYSNFMQRIRVKDGASAAYVWRILMSDVAKEQFKLMSSTTTGLANLNGGIIGSIRVPVPPLPTQQSIADFLDFETGLIDKEINLLTQKNELLSEQRKALIFEAVTGKIEITE